FASHFQLTRGGSIESLVTLGLDGGAMEIHSADAYVLACGTLSTSNVVLRTVYRGRNEIVRLAGLMDNRQILAPFLNLSMLGRNCNLSTYQYHQLAFGIEMGSPAQYVHGQVTTLKTGTAHAIFQNLPLDLKTSIQVFRNLRACLGVLNMNYCDWRRDDNYLTLSKDTTDEGGWPVLSIQYKSAAGEAATIERTCSIARRFFASLGAPLVPGMMHVRPMGSSVHYSGTLPMSAERKPWAVSPTCQSYDIDNLFIVDGAVMPFLPAKNLTFTLMANAVRVAATVF
ncbi:MAG: hypothetical protein JXM70_19795, partial [Pirellulales bacterium]|nr:hypothetical protein [Pirellulales bacterium]